MHCRWKGEVSAGRYSGKVQGGSWRCDAVRQLRWLGGRSDVAGPSIGFNERLHACVVCCGLHDRR